VLWFEAMGETPADDVTPAAAGGGASTVAERGPSPGNRKSAKRKVAASKMAESSGGDQRRGGPPSRRSRLAIYKRNQGNYTRWGTMVGSGVLILAGADFLHDQLGVYQDPDRVLTQVLPVVIPLLVAVGLGLMVYWLSFVNRKACDFLIATEGEMKKVNWSSRREIIGSTKVVIAFTLLLTAILFVVDMVFMTFFTWIGVLREAPSIWKLLTEGGV
jgi:preprotein translocase SecE subunit